jgi:hypothetical protein
MKANKMEKRLRKLLKQIIKVVLAEINQENKTDFKLSDIKFHFTHEITTNETENIENDKIKAETKQIEVNTILNIAASIGDEQALRALCDIMEWDFDELQSKIKKQQEEESLAAAQTALDGVEPTEPTPTPGI